MNKFYITTAIPYTSAKPHIGNTYEAILVDAIARYKKAQGMDVYFLTGSDEHGMKIENAAKEKGISPKEYVDEVTGEIKKILNTVNVEYTDFIKTTDEKHKKTAGLIFEKLYSQGDIYKGEYEGMYCVPCESFFTESQVLQGKCPDCGREVKKAKEEAYFFKMSKYQERLIKHIEDNPLFIYPKSGAKEMLNNFLKPGLQDLCVSRTTFTWGVKVEFDPAHVIYVWIDALTNYISALGYLSGDETLFNEYWPADLQVIGKDILRFHSIYWTCILMALELPLPKQILVHQWLLADDDKMSKSKGNVLYADDLAGLFGADAIRYYVLSEMNYSGDGSVSYDSIISKFNSDLANTLGNLVSRTVSMVIKYQEGEILKPSEETEFDEDLKNTFMQSVKDYFENMNRYHVHDALDNVFALLRRSNKYIDETMPWSLAKDESNKEKLKAVLYNLCECIRACAIMLCPVMPKTAEIILGQVGTKSKDFDSVKSFGNLEEGLKVTAMEPLFLRIDEKKKMEEILG